MIDTRPGDMTWEPALVVRDSDGFYWLRRNEVHWESYRPEFVHNAQTSGELSALGPISVIIDAGGRNVEADGNTLMRSVIALTDKLRETEERANKFRSILATTRSTMVSMVQAYDNVEKQASPETARATLDEQIIIPRPRVPYGPKGISANQSDSNYLRRAASDLADFYRPFGSNLRTTVVKVLQDVADAIEKQGV